MNYKGYIASKILAASMFIVPPPELKPSEYSEQNIVIPDGNALPGHVRFDNVPYQREPLDMIVNPFCRKITLQWASQTGKTQVVSMMIAYHIAHEPFSQMLMQPTEGDYKTWVNTKFNPFVNSNPDLKRLIAKPRGREGVNNTNMKSYPGGFFMGAWAGSPNTQRQRSAPKGYADECDGYVNTEEGCSIELLAQRAATFEDDAMLVVTSTPTIKDDSKVEKSFLEGDQRYFHIPCPHCSELITLQWGQVDWDKDLDAAGNVKEHYPETARYICQECGKTIDHNQKKIALRKGQWIGKKKFRGHASYHLNELYSPFRTFTAIAQSFLDKKAAGSLQTFVNVSLAETWEEDGLKVDHSFLYMRREPYKLVPMAATLLTAAVDVQDDRLEIGVEAWGENEENWKIDYHVLEGDPSRPTIWNKLGEFLQKKYKHESGINLSIVATAIDSGGHFTNEVYKFCKKHRRRRVFAIKGKSGEGYPITNKGTEANKIKCKVFTIGVDTVKELIYQRLVVTEPGAGYIHFPINGLFDEEYFMQLTAEKKTLRYVKGKAIREWKKTRARNEALDVAVYNMAAFNILNPNLKKIRKNMNFPEVPESVSSNQLAVNSEEPVDNVEHPTPNIEHSTSNTNEEKPKPKKRIRRYKPPAKEDKTPEPEKPKPKPKVKRRRRRNSSGWMSGE